MQLYSHPAAELGLEHSRTPDNDTLVFMPIGGRATRAEEITGGNIPKHLIRLDNGETVLETVCKGLRLAGFSRFVFCVGHLKDQIIQHVSESRVINTADTSFDFSEENTPLGVDGCVVNAIRKLSIKGTGLIVPGDMLLPWKNLDSMNKMHIQRSADVTVGLTSCVTERTTDVGRIITDTTSERVLWCYSRTEDMPNEQPLGSRALTSAAVTVINTNQYVDIYDAFLDENPLFEGRSISLRDHVLPWVIRQPDFQIYSYDVEGEALDLGTPSNIRFGQLNWANYLTD